MKTKQTNRLTLPVETAKYYANLGCLQKTEKWENPVIKSRLIEASWDIYNRYKQWFWKK